MWLETPCRYELSCSIIRQVGWWLDITVFGYSAFVFWGVEMGSCLHQLVHMSYEKRSVSGHSLLRLLVFNKHSW